MSEQQHFQDLCDIQDLLADAIQIAEFAEKTTDKLRRLHADIRKRIGQVEVQITRE